MTSLSKSSPEVKKFTKPRGPTSTENKASKRRHNAWIILPVVQVRRLCTPSHPNHAAATQLVPYDQCRTVALTSRAWKMFLSTTLRLPRHVHFMPFGRLLTIFLHDNCQDCRAFFSMTCTRTQSDAPLTVFVKIVGASILGVFYAPQKVFFGTCRHLSRKNK